MIKRLSFWNTVSRILFLMLTPAFFRLFDFAFIWHSIYWGVISFVVIIWFTFLLISPLCGKCVDVCNKDALNIKFVWNRRKFRAGISPNSTPFFERNHQ